MSDIFLIKSTTVRL